MEFLPKKCLRCNRTARHHGHKCAPKSRTQHVHVVQICLDLLSDMIFLNPKPSRPAVHVVTPGGFASKIQSLGDSSSSESGNLSFSAKNLWVIGSN